MASAIFGFSPYPLFTYLAAAFFKKFPEVFVTGGLLNCNFNHHIVKTI